MPQTLTIYLDDDKLIARLKEEATRQDRSVSWIVRMILDEHLARQRCEKLEV